MGASTIQGLVKVPGIAADLGVAWFIYLIADRFFGDHPPIRWLGSGARIGLIGAAVYLFNPGTVFNSAVWGQMDSVGLVVIWPACTRWGEAGPKRRDWRPWWPC